MSTITTPDVAVQCARCARGVMSRTLWSITRERYGLTLTDYVCPSCAADLCGTAGYTIAPTEPTAAERDAAYRAECAARFPQVTA